MDKNYQAAYRKTVEGNKLIGALATTNTMDRDGDVIDTNGVDLQNFMKNPVLLWSHNHDSLPIGKVTDLRRTDNGIEFDAEFSESLPLAQQIKDLFAEGILNAFSIGFIPKERRNSTITSSELVEISAVNVPANPEALLSRYLDTFETTDSTTIKTIKAEVEPVETKEPEAVEKKEDEKVVEQKDMTVSMMSMMGQMMEMMSEIKDMVYDMMPEDEPVEAMPEPMPMMMMRSKKENKKEKLLKIIKSINN